MLFHSFTTHPGCAGRICSDTDTMAGSINKVTLLGNLGQDPEVRTFQNGGRVVNMRIATSDSWKDRTTGERKERTEWHTVAIFSEPLGRIAEQYLKKGSKVYIEGKLETRKWQDQNGQDRYSTEIVLRPYGGELVLIDRRQEGGRSDQDQGGRPAPSSQPNRQGSQPYANAPQRGAPYGNPPGGYQPNGGREYDDDIPF